MRSQRGEMITGAHPTMRSLLRTVELDKPVDADPRAMYFRQAMNGLYVRMALLTMLLDKE